VNQRQEVNLYLPQLQPTVDYLSVAVVTRGIVLLVLMLVMTACFDLYQNYQLHDDLELRQTSIDSLQQQIISVKKQLPKSQKIRLDREIRALGVEIKRRQAISRLIDGQSIGNTEGFSEQLSMLSQKSSKKISLSQFGLSVGGGVVSLAGETRAPESVPAYIDRLRQSDSFSSSVFGPMSISRQNSSSLLSFSLNQKDESGVQNE